jgi:hypothetical protein
MQAENLTGKAEADTGPLLLGRKKRNEDFSQGFLDYPDPIILYGNDNLAFRAQQS